MGLHNILSGQLLQSISYRSNDPTELASLYDRDGRRIMYKSVLTVMPGQAAVFVNEGQITDIYMSGRYELTTENMPLTTTLKEWKYGFKESFIVDIIFINMNEILDVKWGTSEQVTVKDDVFGLVNVGANGTYSFKITDPKKFVENVMGTKNRVTTADLRPFVTPQISMYFKEIVTDRNLDFFDMQGFSYEAAQILQQKSEDFFGRFGIEIVKMSMQVALPAEVRQAINERATVGAMGGMQAYTSKKQADAIGDMAKNPNGNMGAMAGAGMGMAMGSMMMNNFANMQNQSQQNQGQQAQSQQAGTIKCPKCGADIPSGSKFCPQCGQKIAEANAFCPQCGKPVPAGSKFCPNCGAKIG